MLLPTTKPQTRSQNNQLYVAWINEIKLVERSSISESRQYEAFICLARLCEPGEHGSDFNYMKNVIDIEMGLAETSFNYYQQLARVKLHMTTAVITAFARRFTIPHKKRLNDYMFQIESATNSAALLEICDDGILCFLKYK